MNNFNVYGEEFSKVYNKFWKGFISEIGPKLVEMYLGFPISKLNNKIIDLCCGTGRLMKYFLENGFQVSGIDQSEFMLNIVKDKYHQYFDSGRITLYQNSAQNFSFDSKVGLVVSTFDSMNHIPNLAEIEKVFNCVYNVLENKGLFIFDVNTIKSLSNWNFIDLEQNDGTVFITHGKYEAGNDKAYTHVYGFIKQNENCYKKFDEIMFNSLFQLQELEKLLLTVGFKSVKYFTEQNMNKSYQGDPEKLDRVFILCEK